MCAKQVLLPLSLAALLTLLGVSMLALHRHRVRQDHHSGVREKRTSGDEFVYMNQLHRVLWTKQLAPSSQKKFQRLPEDLLDDVFIAVKTSAKFHRTRLDVILKTWFKLAEKQVRAPWSGKRETIRHVAITAVASGGFVFASFSLSSPHSLSDRHKFGLDFKTSLSVPSKQTLPEGLMGKQDFAEALGEI